MNIINKQSNITFILVTGGRNYSDIGMVFDRLLIFHEQSDRLIVIHGDATGADRLANDVCVEIGIEQVKVPAAWNRYNRAAGTIRNQLMLDLFPHIDMILAFPGGTGTADMVARAKKAGITVIDAVTMTEL